jgi:hypothetical protein
MTLLLPYQVPHVENLVASVKRWGAALDASDAGTGKTYAALATAKALNHHAFILCPKVVIPMWERVATEMGVKHAVLNYEMARLHGIKKYKNTIYLLDEVHVCSGLDTLNAKLLVNIKNTGCPLLMLSATVAETPLKLWAIGYALGLHNGIGASKGMAQNPFVKTGMNFYQWCFHMGVRRLQNIGTWYYSGKPEDTKRLHGVIFPTRGSRMRKQDIPEFPEVQNTVEEVKAEPIPPQLEFIGERIKQRRLDLLQALSLEPDEEAPLTGPESDPSLADAIYERMETELLKVAPLAALARLGIEEGNNVVVFVNFRTTLEALSILFPNAAVIQGGQNPTERQDAIDRFQNEDVHLLIATLESGGASISLHDLIGNRPRMSLISPGWRAVSLIQALGRVHRAGAKTKAWNRIVLVENSIEKKVANKLRKKISQIEGINNGDLDPESDLAFLHKTYHSTERTNSI